MPELIPASLVLLSESKKDCLKLFMIIWQEMLKQVQHDGYL
jgi:hypothetical protein